MHNSMIIEHDSGNREHFICPCMNCEVENPNNPIPVFYSYKHAIDSGWVHTWNILYCDPDRDEAVWVCPSCYKKGDKR